MSGWGCGEVKGLHVDGSVEKRKSDVWMGVRRRERVISGWEYGEENVKEWIEV